MNKDIRFIISKVKEYAGISSLSGHEQAFLCYLKANLPNKYYSLQEYTDCLFYKYHKPTNWLVLVHTDRIRVEKYQFEAVNNTMLKGQLDNVISVAIMRFLMDKDIPVNILFTTNEEILKSCPQIVHVCYGKDYYVLDLDIDVAVKTSEIESGAISLRDRDTTAVFDKGLVKYMRKLCDDHGISYITKNGDWLVDQLGCTIAGVPSIKGAYFGLPIWEYHSNHELISFKCIENAIQLFEYIKNDVCLIKRLFRYKPKEQAKLTKGDLKKVQGNLWKERIY